MGLTKFRVLPSIYRPWNLVGALRTQGTWGPLGTWYELFTIINLMFYSRGLHVSIYTSCLRKRVLLSCAILLTSFSGFHANCANVIRPYLDPWNNTQKGNSNTKFKIEIPKVASCTFYLRRTNAGTPKNAGRKCKTHSKIYGKKFTEKS